MISPLVLVGVNCEELKVETVGAVRSMVIVAVASVALEGPVLPAVSVAPLIANRGISVPPEHEVTLTVKVVAEVEVGAKTHPVALPAFEKSPATTLEVFIDLEKVKVKVMAELEFVGVVCAEVKEEIVGLVRSMVITELEVAAPTGPAFVALSLTAFAFN